MFYIEGQEVGKPFLSWKHSSFLSEKHRMSHRDSSVGGLCQGTPPKKKRERPQVPAEGGQSEGRVAEPELPGFGPCVKPSGSWKGKLSLSQSNHENR